MHAACMHTMYQRPIQLHRRPAIGLHEHQYALSEQDLLVTYLASPKRYYRCFHIHLYRHSRKKRPLNVRRLLRVQYFSSCFGRLKYWHATYVKYDRDELSHTGLYKWT